MSELPRTGWPATADKIAEIIGIGDPAVIFDADVYSDHDDIFELRVRVVTSITREQVTELIALWETPG